MPRIEFLHCPDAVFAGASFDVVVAVENSAEGETVEIELRRLDVDEGSWEASASIGSSDRGTARFRDVCLRAAGTAHLKCKSTSHIVVPAATTVRVVVQEEIS